MNSNSNSNAVLRGHVEQIEKLEAEKADLAGDIREVYKAVKGSGFDPKILRKVIAIRRRNASELEAERDFIETYLAALGIL